MLGGRASDSAHRRICPSIGFSIAWPLAELIEKHRSNAPSDRCVIGSDGHRIGLGSDGHRIGLGLAGQPFEFEPEYNGEQAIDDRMLPSCPRRRARATPPATTLPEAGPGTPPARVLLQEVRNS